MTNRKTARHIETNGLGGDFSMDQRDLSKLKRSELLEIMLAQSEEIDHLRAELKEKDRQLQERRIAIGNAGSIAEASLALTKIFEEAQKAADLYLYNVKLAGGSQVQAGAPPSAGTPTDASGAARHLR